MAEDKVAERRAKLESTIGVDRKGKDSWKGGLSRRAFGGVVAAGVVAGAAAGFIKALTEREDRGAEVFPPEGFFGIFQGIIHVRRGAVIYDRPATWIETEPEWPYTTSSRQETRIEEIGGEEEEFKIECPILFFRPANQFSTQTSEVGEQGREREVDLGASYVVIEEIEGLPESVVSSIRRSTTKLGCINMGVPGTLGYQPRGEIEFQFTFTPQAVRLSS